MALRPSAATPSRCWFTDKAQKGSLAAGRGQEVWVFLLFLASRACSFANNHGIDYFSFPIYPYQIEHSLRVLPPLSPWLVIGTPSTAFPSLPQRRTHRRSQSLHVAPCLLSQPSRSHQKSAALLRRELFLVLGGCARRSHDAVNKVQGRPRPSAGDSHQGSTCRPGDLKVVVSKVDAASSLADIGPSALAAEREQKKLVKFVSPTKPKGPVTYDARGPVLPGPARRQDGQVGSAAAQGQDGDAACTRFVTGDHGERRRPTSSTSNDVGSVGLDHHASMEAGFARLAVAGE
ncbi:hypothetical protein CMUS01_00662 [Colletotrichum musicola]|uniref:Uncharacterized protein n=1 Tax=Colletotrichum musicola TaxID=2175873 RepID=A0A8H6NYN9_9PEZI|nr:hypothetical protein CMUS01_00662 [Colletotrichum musicola]